MTTPATEIIRADHHHAKPPSVIERLADIPEEEIWLPARICGSKPRVACGPVEGRLIDDASPAEGRQCMAERTRQDEVPPAKRSL